MSAVARAAVSAVARTLVIAVVVAVDSPVACAVVVAAFIVQVSVVVSAVFTAGYRVIQRVIDGIGDNSLSSPSQLVPQAVHGLASKRMLRSSQGLRVIGALVEIRSMPVAA